MFLYHIINFKIRFKPCRFYFRTVWGSGYQTCHLVKNARFFFQTNFGLQIILMVYYSISIYSRLSLSWSQRDPLKNFEISALRHIRFAELRQIPIKLSNEHVIWLLYQKYMLKILWKRGEIAPEEKFLLLSTIFCYLKLDFYVNIRIRFSLRDKR